MKRSLNRIPKRVLPFLLLVVLSPPGGGGASASAEFDSGQVYFLSSRINPGPESIAVGDLNGDGHLDLATADNGFLSLLFGDGNGAFPTLSTLSTRPSNATDVVVSDDNEFVLLFDADGNGLPDLFAPNIFAQFTALTLFRNNPAAPGTFFSPPTRITQGIGTSPAALAAVHLNPGQDSFVDVVLATSNSPRVRTFLGNGQGSFVAGASFNLSSSPASSAEDLVAGDMNRDGLADIVVVDRQRVWVLLNDGAGGLVRSASATSSAFASEHLEYSVDLGDFNGDGFLDAVVGNGGIFDNLTTTAHSIVVFFGDGQGGLDPTPVSIDVGTEVADVLAADFDNDGRLDILAAVPDFFSDIGGAVVIPGNGDGSFDLAARIDLPAQGVATTAVAAADLNKNGRLDVVLGNEGYFTGSPFDASGNVVVYLNALPPIGTATPTPTPTLSPTPTPTRTPIEIGDRDINGDGSIDALDLLILLEQLGNRAPNP